MQWFNTSYQYAYKVSLLHLTAKMLKRAQTEACVVGEISSETALFVDTDEAILIIQVTEKPFTSK